MQLGSDTQKSSQSHSIFSTRPRGSNRLSLLNTEITYHKHDFT